LEDELSYIVAERSKSMSNPEYICAPKKTVRKRKSAKISKQLIETSISEEQ
jgi:hypothetical protein